MRRRRLLALLSMTMASTACGDLAPSAPGVSAVPTTAPRPLTLPELIRFGSIKIGFNEDASMLVQRSGSTYAGVYGEIANAIARELGVAVAGVPLQKLEHVFDAGRHGTWDIAFAESNLPQPGIQFSNPFMNLEWLYLVPQGSPIARPSDADQPGVRIATYDGTPLHLYLQRSLNHATVFATAGDQRSIEIVNLGQADVVAGSRHQLTRFADQMSGGRLLPEPMFISRHAIAVAIGRDDLLNIATAWIERAKTSGLLTDVIARSGARGASVAAPGP